MNRRQFLKRAALVSGAAVLAACGAEPTQEAAPSSSAPLQSAAPTAGPAAASTGVPTAAAGNAATRGQPPTSEPAPSATVPAEPAVTPAPIATPTPSEAAWRGRVALVKTTDRAAGVAQAIALLGINEVRGNRVLLKPNFNSADPAPGSTHPDVLRALVSELQNLGAKSVTVGDRSGMGRTAAVMQQLAVPALAKELGFSTVIFDDFGEIDWVLQQSRDMHWSQGFAVPKLLLDSDAVVQTCNLKTHRFGGHFTLSLKNSVGLVAKQTAAGGYNYMSELHGSQYQRHMIAEINQVYAPALIVLDAVEGFGDGGPDRGRVIKPGVILASLDRIALDAVGVAMLRLHGTTPQVSQGRIFDQAQIARAVELEIGARRPDDITIITQDAAGEKYAAQLRPLFLA